MDSTLLNDEKEALKEFLAKVNQLPDEKCENVNSKTALKFLIARKFDVGRALELYISHQNTRKKENLFEINPREDSTKQELLSGKLTVFSEKDGEGGCILLFTARLHFPLLTSHQAVLQALVFQLDCALESRVAQKNGIIFIYDMTDSKFLNFDYDLSIKILNMLKGSYPARLKKVLILTAPLWFKAPFKVLRLFILEKLRGRVHVISASELANYLPISSIPIHLGGTLQLDHRGWLTKCLFMFQNDHACMPAQNHQDQQQENSKSLEESFFPKKFDSYFQDSVMWAGDCKAPLGADEGFVGDDSKATATTTSSTSLSSCEKTSADSFLDTDDDNVMCGDDEVICCEQDIDEQQHIIHKSSSGGSDSVSKRSGSFSSMGRKRMAGSDLDNPSKRRLSCDDNTGHPSESDDLPVASSSNSVSKDGAIYSHSMSINCINDDSDDEEEEVDEDENDDEEEDEHENIEKNLSCPESKSMTARQLYNHCKAMGQIGLEKEYLSLRAVPKPGTFRLSRLRVNQMKNRYSDVPCLDETRVRIINYTESDKDSNDYINANFVDGFNLKKAYISTQGPLAKTFADFWQMVWEQNVLVLVMTTRIVERGRVKCDQYWPSNVDKVEKHSNLTIRNVGSVETTSYIVTTLMIQNNMTSEIRELKHVHFIGWPDHGVPDCADTFLDFLYFVRVLQEEQRAKLVSSCGNPCPISVGVNVQVDNADHGEKICCCTKTCPILVHCSAGIGRTGTFIAIDILTRALDELGRVDIVDTVRNLRNQRALSIQTPDQYVFCYEALVSHASRTNLLSNDDDIPSDCSSDGD